MRPQKSVRNRRNPQRRRTTKRRKVALYHLGVQRGVKEDECCEACLLNKRCPYHEFEVEEITDVRERTITITEFQVKWKGYDSRENTWEIEQHMLGSDTVKMAQEMIRKKRSGDEEIDILEDL